MKMWKKKKKKKKKNEKDERKMKKTRKTETKIFCFRLFRFFSSLSRPFRFFLLFSFHIFIHCHPLQRYGLNFMSLAHREVSLKSITIFHPDRYTRKRVNKSMVKYNWCKISKTESLLQCYVSGRKFRKQ